MPKTQIDNQYEYYKKHEKELLKKYSGKVIVIKDESVVGVYSDEATAYEDANDKYELGTFLIQRCVPAKEAVQFFHSRVLLS